MVVNTPAILLTHNATPTVRRFDVKSTDTDFNFLKEYFLKIKIEYSLSCNIIELKGVKYFKQFFSFYLPFKENLRH